MKHKKILHVVPDHNNFLKDAIDMFNSIPEIENECWVVRKKAIPPTNLGINNAKGVDYDTFISKCVDSCEYDIIIIHNLLCLEYRFIAAIHPSIKVVWLSWGMDIYDYRFPEYPLIKLKQTIKSNRLNFYFSELFNRKYFKQIISKYIRNNFHPRLTFNKAISRIDYYSGVFPQEWEMLTINKYFKAKQFHFNYSNASSPYSPENLYKGLNHERTNIQVGHSGYIYLNHTHVFNLLKKHNLGNAQIISPLSYAASGEKYVQKVISFGKNIFGNKFIALTKFMPYVEYTNTMKSIRIAIFDIERQCAVGNCLIAIWNGAKLFFPQTSLNYKYFTAIGIKVFSIEHELNDLELNTGLDIDTIIYNRQQIIKYWNHENIKIRLSDSIRSIFL